MRINKKAAIRCPVLGPFIFEAQKELAVHWKFKVAPLLKRLGIKHFRSYVHENLNGSIRNILEQGIDGGKVGKVSGFGRMVPITADGEVAGRGRGKRMVGFVRNCAKHSSEVDESLRRRVDMVSGVALGHNDMAQELEVQIKQDRDRLNVELKPLLKPPAERLAGPTVDMAKRALSAFGEIRKDRG